MSATSRHILTAPAWPYANGPRHIGHVSGFGLPADMFSRYQRMAGNNVLMVSGTDEHGTPIQVQADAAGVTARELADRYNRVIAGDLVGLDMSYNLFTRTTTRNHYATTQEIFKGLYDNGYIFEKTAMGAMSPTCAEFALKTWVMTSWFSRKRASNVLVAAPRPASRSELLARQVGSPDRATSSEIAR